MVDEYHNYFVSNLGVWTHNQESCGYHKHGIYEDAPYHGKSNSGKKNKAPKSGQKALDNSISIKGTTARRVGISNGEFVVLDETSKGLYHGHVRAWNELTQDMQNALYKAGLTNRKGKIL